MDDSRNGSGAVKKPRLGARDKTKPGAGTLATETRLAYKASGIVGEDGRQDNTLSGQVRLRLIKDDGFVRGPARGSAASTATVSPEASHLRTSGKGVDSMARRPVAPGVVRRLEKAEAGALLQEADQKATPLRGHCSPPARPLRPGDLRVGKKAARASKATEGEKKGPEAGRVAGRPVSPGPQAPVETGGGGKKGSGAGTDPAGAESLAAKTAKRKEDGTGQAPKGPVCDLYAPPKFSLATLIAYTLLASVLLLGWAYRGEEIFTAKEGAGYIMGIVGGSMMLLLLLYPLRKTARFMRRMGPIKHWFRAHMVFGLLGPALILFHSNFSMGSLNSSVALVIMILVALSGIVGRYIYSGIHYGLYGREMDLNELRKAFEDRSHGMKYVLDYAPGIQEKILAFDARVLKPRYTFLGSLWGLLTNSVAALWLRLVLVFVLRRTLQITAKRHKWSAEELKAHGRGARRYISNHIAAAMVIARFKVYERLFSLWHLLHLPLFLMLVLTAIIHVVAVHMF